MGGPGRTRATLVAVVGAAVLMVTADACAQQPGQSQLGADAKVREEVLAVVRAYSEYISTQDWDAFLGLFWPGATLSAIRRPDSASERDFVISQVTERVADLAPLLRDNPLFEASLAVPAVLIQGNLAMVWAPSDTRIGGADDPAGVPGVDAFTLLHLNGSWKVVSLAYQADAVTNPLPEGGSRQSILTTIERYYSDLSNQNWTRYATHFWPGATVDAVLRPAGADSARIASITTPDLIELVRDELDREPIFEVRMGSAQVLVRRNLAQVWASYRVRLGDVNVSEWHGTNAFTLIRFRGRWRIASLAYDTDTDQDRIGF